ncbi:MAG: PLDc_N domain-containing protein [Mucilaginibacter sp.]|nr:PLDc_N domain-containing protein [Mucilaginibacter sp.]
MNILAFFEFSVQEVMLLAVVMLFYPLLTLYCLVDIVRSDFKDSATKIIWALIVFFAPIFGSIIYLVIGRQSKVINP